MKKKLTIRQAYDVMTNFLEMYWKETDCDEIAGLLSDMSTEIWADGSTGDPAIWGEWEESVRTIVGNEQELTIRQAFKAMTTFLEQYIPFKTPSHGVFELMNGIKIFKDGTTSNPIFWKHWLVSVQGVFDTNESTE